MAVETLKKLTVICSDTQQEAVLKVLQGLQRIQLEDLYEDEKNEAWLERYFPAVTRLNQGDTEELDHKLKQLRESILFIKHNGDAKQKVTELKRKAIDFETAEAGFDETATTSELAEIDKLMAAWETNRQETRNYQEMESWATDWHSLDLDPAVKGSRAVKTIMATVPNDQWQEFSGEIHALENIYLEVYATQMKETAMGLTFLKGQSPQVYELLQAFGGKEEHNPYQQPPAELLQTAKAKLAELVEERDVLTRQIGVKKAKVADLQFAEEIYLARRSRELGKQGILRSSYLILIQGWLPESEVSGMERRIQQRFPNGEIYLSYEEPTEAEIESNKLPIKLKNASFIKPFEMLTEMYSLPKYREIDPTPWMTPFYFVFFGMMVADAGYGALMLIATTVALKTMTLAKGTARFMKLFQYLSIPTIGWGLVYGSCFGAALPFYLLSPSKDFMAIFGISMVFAGIQLFCGLFLAAKENIKKKDYLAAVNQGFSWQGILAGILIAAAGALVLKSSTMTMIGTILAIVSALLVVLTSMLQAESKVGGFFMGLYDLYGITSYIGDFVSYSRLMALGISGGSIAAAFNMLVGYMPPAARFTAGIVLIVILQALNIFLSLLSAYVHAARLQYVEFFGKFYEGGGKPFKAFKPEEKYVNFKEEIGGNDK